MPPIPRPFIRRRRRRSVASMASVAFAMTMCAAPGCESGNHNDPQTPATAPAQRDLTPPAEGETSMVKTTAADARAHGLPAATISVEPGATGMAASTFPEDGVYLRLSGPPGGPLGLIMARATTAGDEAGMKALVNTRFTGRSPAAGTFARVELGDAVRPAITCTTDSSAARAHHLLVLFAQPGVSGGVLLDFWMPAGTSPTPEPREMLEHARYAALLKSVSVRFE